VMCDIMNPQSDDVWLQINLLYVLVKSFQCRSQWFHQFICSIERSHYTLTDEQWE
jgi:hypothetical protein